MSEHNAPPGWTYCPNCAHPWSDAVRGDASLRCAECGWWWLLKPVDENAARLDGARIVRDAWRRQLAGVLHDWQEDDQGYHAALLEELPKTDADLEKLIEGEG